MLRSHATPGGPKPQVHRQDAASRTASRAFSMGSRASKVQHLCDVVQEGYAPRCHVCCSMPGTLKSSCKSHRNEAPCYADLLPDPAVSQGLARSVSLLTDSMTNAKWHVIDSFIYSDLLQQPGKWEQSVLTSSRGSKANISAVHSLRKSHTFPTIAAAYHTG